MQIFTLFFILAISLVGRGSDVADVDGEIYINHGLKGYGFLAGDFTDKYNDTISFGSSISLQKNSVFVTDGVYKFTTYNLPDRGWNTNGTLNFVPRIYKFAVAFTPKDSSNSSNLVWDYIDTILLRDFNGNYMTGLDCNTTLEQNGYTLPASEFTGDGFGRGDQSKFTTRVCLDPESLNLVEGDISKGFWITDEYGPGIYKFNSSGLLVDFLLPPKAILPYRDGKISFSADSPPIYASYDVGDPESGRADNQGFEGGTISPDGKFLFALSQSANVQEGGEKKYTNSYIRLLKFDVSGTESKLVAEYVLKLPTYEDPDYSDDKNPRTAAQSELVYVKEDVFLVLARDSNRGRTFKNTTSIYRHADLYSVANATNILGLYDGEGDKIASEKGKLKHDIVTATYYPFLNYNNETELAKFGLHNGGEDDSELLNEKWEGITLVPVEGETDRYYLVTVSDDDFITQRGFMGFGGYAYADGSGWSLDNQALVFEVTLASQRAN